MKTLKVVLLVAVLVALPPAFVSALKLGNSPEGETVDKAGEEGTGTEEMVNVGELSLEDLVQGLEAESYEPEIRVEANRLMLEKLRHVLRRVDELLRKEGKTLDLSIGEVRLLCVFPGFKVKFVDEITTAQLGIGGGLGVLDLGDAFADSGLQKYDIITAINGAQIRNVADLNKAITDAPEKEKSKIEIMRGGKADVVNFLIPRPHAPEVPSPDKPETPDKPVDEAP
jgi:hypothetical protein